MKSYAGIGSRQTPDKILNDMIMIGVNLADMGYTLRSGGANGADSAFEEGANHSINGNAPDPVIFKADDCTEAAKDMAADYHPAWERCNGFVRKLHGRNCMIILGAELNDPVEFIVCWTVDGKITGGTGQALRMAQKLGIKVHNLAINNFQLPLL